MLEAGGGELSEAGECLPHFCLPGGVKAFFFFVLGHCLKFSVGPRKKEGRKESYYKSAIQQVRLAGVS